jgi:hypothetical protein
VEIKKNEKGILVIAQGHERYLNMACNLAVSLRLTNPHIPLALVTDKATTEAKKIYDYIIDINPQYGIGFSQKIHMDIYSPFEKTLFIDADCLVIDNIDFLWKGFNGKPVSVLGYKKAEGEFLGTTIEQLREKLSFSFLPSFNGGVYYFEKGAAAIAVFSLARELFYNRYDELSLVKFSGKPGDEPVMSLAMGMHNMQPLVDAENRGMFTPVGQHGFFKMNAPTGYCEFLKHGTLVKPVIMHFGGGYPEAFHYRREIRKFRLMYYSGFSKTLAGAWVNFCRNPWYILRVFCYRVAKRIVKGTPFKWKPAKPMFIFE